MSSSPMLLPSAMDERVEWCKGLPTNALGVPSAGRGRTAASAAFILRTSHANKWPYSALASESRHRDASIGLNSLSSVSSVMPSSRLALEDRWEARSAIGFFVKYLASVAASTPKPCAASARGRSSTMRDPEPLPSTSKEMLPRWSTATTRVNIRGCSSNGIPIASSDVRSSSSFSFALSRSCAVTGAAWAPPR
eukprot:scaffold168468_cov31-Tisochrysis_lutea.AAC.2